MYVFITFVSLVAKVLKAYIRLTQKNLCNLKMLALSKFNNQYNLFQGLKILKGLDNDVPENNIFKKIQIYM